MELLIATRNTGKVKEIEELLADLPVTLRSLEDFANLPEPAETGSNFTENAALKAAYYALKTGLHAIADDSGLEVEALGGAPGIFSARYAGAHATDGEKIEKLLRELERTADKNRAARFVCAIALADETGRIIYTTEGICSGRIASAPSEKNGFGYDPVFIPENFSNTFGELSSGAKRKISHRSRAIRKIIAFLRDFIAA